MKKQVLIATGLAVLSTNAFATEARMEALGQNQARGSFYIEDTRDVFRNAAHINLHKNYVVTEWGTAAAGAEGGFYREGGNFVYGLYLGRDSDSALSDQTVGSVTSAVTTGFETEENALDLFFGGDAGVEWGARVHYSSHDDSTGQAYEKSHSALGVGLGVMMGDLGAYTNLDLSNEAEGNNAASGDKLEADLGLNVGVTYGMGSWTFFADYAKTGWEYTDADGFDPTFESSVITVGAGYTHEVSSSARIFTDIAYVMSSNELKNSATQTLEEEDTYLPLTIAFEADANSWLTLRGSVSQPVIFNKREVTGETTTTNNGEATRGDATTIGAGFTLNYGKLKLDATVTGAANGEVVDFTDSLGSNVAMHYWF